MNDTCGDCVASLFCLLDVISGRHRCSVCHRNFVMPLLEGQYGEDRKSVFIGDRKCSQDLLGEGVSVSYDKHFLVVRPCTQCQDIINHSLNYDENPSYALYDNVRKHGSEEEMQTYIWYWRSKQEWKCSRDKWKRR